MKFGLSHERKTMSVILYGVFTIFLFIVCFANADEIVVCSEARDEVLSGKDSWLFTKADLWSDFYIDESMIELLTRFNIALRRQNIQLIVAPLPRRGTTHPEFLLSTVKEELKYDIDAARHSYFQFVNTLNELGIRSVDLLSSAIIASRQDGEAYYYRLDNHWSAVGAREAAAIIGAAIRESPEYLHVPKKNFMTSFDEIQQQEGYIAGLLSKACGTELILEEVYVYSTQAIESEGILDDVEKPAIVLVGTSQSLVKPPNFAGFLMEAVSADILNVSQHAGGRWRALDVYFTSDTYIESKPLFLVWEFPIWFIPNQEAKVLRQIIPAISGKCDSSRTLGKDVIKIEGTELVFFEKDGSPSFLGYKDYLYFEFEDQSVFEFEVTLKYEDNSSESVKISRLNNVENSGRYFLEVLSSVSELMVSIPEDKNGVVELTLCKGQ